ncbi:MAG: FHA domain-containing protein [Actinobacteria bacterium]|nr:FHA domain-containing protein [Actinomycetota bacterium]
MKQTQPVPGLTRVPTWPRLTAELHSDNTGTLTINGTSRACAAESVAALRTGLIARAVSYAMQLRRPVRLNVTEAAESYKLAVRPEGYVQLVDAGGIIPAADGLSVDEGRCRHCRRLQPVTSTTCIQCHIEEPLRVEVTPHGEPLDAPPIPVDAPEELPADVDEVMHLAEVPLTPTSGSAPVSTTVPAPELDDDVEATRVRRPGMPSLRLAFTTQRSVTVPGRVVVGREPVAKDGQHAVPVVSPGRQLSRTHAAIEVDQDARIIVTDLNAPNGVGLLTTPPRWLTPAEPTIVPIGVKLLMGDVECVVTLA